MLVLEGTFQSLELVHVDLHLWQHKDCSGSEWHLGAHLETSGVHKERLPDQVCYQQMFLEGAAVEGLVGGNP